jgi:hypothetical protein
LEHTDSLTLTSVHLLIDGVRLLALTGRQRELLTQQMTTRPAPTCIMTASPLVRAITALLFFNRGMKVVALDERERAYDFLGLSGTERTTADRLRRELEAEIGVGAPPAGAPRT